MVDTAKRVLEVNELIRIYGGLLTPRQFDVLTRRYAHDQSLGEIAEVDNISRQGVRVVELQALRVLHKLENKLGIRKWETAENMLWGN